MHKNKLTQAAINYINNNISVIATGGDKRALFPWKEFQERIISQDEIKRQLSHFKATGMAVICGKVSGNLEVIDIDTKNDLTGKLYDNLCDNIPNIIYDRLRIVQTVSGGYHIYYRCDAIDGNQKLAMRGASEDELKDSPHLKEVVLIETRAEGGYVVAPPSPGYKVIKQNHIPTLTEDERDTLLSICRSFSQLSETEIIHHKEKGGYGVTPWDDYNKRGDSIALLLKHGWTIVKNSGERTYFKRPGKTDSIISGNFHHGHNTFIVFSTSTQFTPNKGYSPFGIYCLLEHGGDPSKAAKALIKEGYGEKSGRMDNKVKRVIRQLREQGYDDATIKDKLIADHRHSSAEAADVLSEYDKQAGEKIATFWSVDDKGKITVERAGLTSFLSETGGFGRYYYSPNVNIYRIIKEEDGFLSESSPDRIKDYVTDYITSLEPREPFDHGTTAKKLNEVIQCGAKTFFSKDLMEFLKEKHFNFLKDTPEEAFFPFKNGVVCVTKDGAKLKTYGEMKKVIWKSQVIDFNITIDNDFDTSLCEFYRFINLISGKDQDKTDYCINLIGYLIHKYKDPSRPWAVIFAEETDDERKGGGTGKGILAKAIGRIINTVNIDGKNFKADKSFAFQRVALDTRLVFVEDVRKNVDFEGYYSIITEGITVEKKNKDELYIPYEDSPKIAFSTNYTVPAVGTHAQRRQRVFEFSDYFNKSHTPADEFGHRLFGDWDGDEWNRFYNLMFYCASKYLTGGAVDISGSDTFKRKHIRVGFSEEFLEYFDNLIGNGCANWHNFGKEYDQFLSSNEFDKKEYSAKRFKRALSDSCETMGYKMVVRRNRMDGNKREFMIKDVPDFLKNVPPQEVDEFEL